MSCIPALILLTNNVFKTLCSCFLCFDYGTVSAHSISKLGNCLEPSQKESLFFWFVPDISKVDEIRWLRCGEGGLTQSISQGPENAALGGVTSQSQALKV